MAETDIAYDRNVSRWEPDGRGRLVQAAMQLYGEHGYEQTTVAEIAERAGLTERTFFRHFADKREVLFFGSADLQAVMVEALDQAPREISPLDAVAAALDAAAGMLGSNREHSRARQSLITANPALQERELVKMATLAGVLADGVRRRGVPDPAAVLTAEAGIAVFRVSFERWIADDRAGSLADVMRDGVAQLRAVAAVT
jgi:AcrR family transcriptional regulator